MGQEDIRGGNADSGDPHGVPGEKRRLSMWFMVLAVVVVIGVPVTVWVSSPQPAEDTPTFKEVLAKQLNIEPLNLRINVPDAGVKVGQLFVREGELCQPYALSKIKGKPQLSGQSDFSIHGTAKRDGALKIDFEIGKANLVGEKFTDVKLKVTECTMLRYYKKDVEDLIQETDFQRLRGKELLFVRMAASGKATYSYDDSIDSRGDSQLGWDKFLISLGMRSGANHNYAVLASTQQAPFAYELIPFRLGVNLAKGHEPVHKGSGYHLIELTGEEAESVMARFRLNGLRIPVKSAP